MKRRNFLKSSTPLFMSPFLVNGLPYKSFATPKMMSLLENCEGVGDRALVLIFLNGGNDGLNTLVPIEQYDLYANYRPTTKINQNNLIDLDTTLPIAEQIGLHPALQPLKELYDTQRLNIIQGVGYDTMNGSHFKSTDLWMTGGDGQPENFNHTTGWMGRYLAYTYPGVAGNPNNLMPDPLGIQLGSRKPSLGFGSPEPNPAAINLAGQDPSGFYSLVSEVGGVPITDFPASEYGQELEYIMNIENSTNTYAQRISNVFENGSNDNQNYPDHYLADQLKTVAKLISGGCKTKIYLLELSGFDTHSNQVEEDDSTIGQHTTLLTRLAESVKAFQDDIEGLGIADKVLTLTFSEFGREVTENGSYGTDHGTIAPMFLIGTNVNPGITGTNVSLDLNDLEQNQTQLGGMQYDYREVYATMLQDWLGTDSGGLSAAYFDDFNKLNLLAASSVVAPSCYLSGGLPVELVHFSARAEENKRVLIEWETASEHNNNYFEIERSPDGKDFRVIMRVDSQGESDTPSYYEEYDMEPLLGESYYRLKQVDYNGRLTYFEMQRVLIQASESVGMKLYPNPAIYDANLVITSSHTYDAKITIISVSGRLIETRKLKVEEGFNKFRFDVARLANGNYYVMVENLKNKQKDTLPLIVQQVE